jgi:hypothetical protein
MKTKLAALAVFLAPALAAAPLTTTTAVHTKPDEASPAITFLKAGTEPTPAAGSLASTPAGWMAIDVPGPFEAYVQNKDLTKSLDVKTGASLYLGPNEASGVLTVAEKGDKTSITGLHGKWTQIKLERNLVAYIHVGGVPGYVPPIATTPAGSTPAPDAATAAPTAEPGKAAPTTPSADSTSALPRHFAGKFVSTQSPFRPRRPYDWALNDAGGKRYAYLDVSKLLLTQQIEQYADHDVVVFGAARPSTDGKEIIIAVETLQLK